MQKPVGVREVQALLHWFLEVRKRGQGRMAGGEQWDQERWSTELAKSNSL